MVTSLNISLTYAREKKMKENHMFGIDNPVPIMRLLPVESDCKTINEKI